MKVEPSITPAGKGAFTVEGMRFHMQGPGEDGRWVLELVIRDGEVIDRAVAHITRAIQEDGSITEYNEPLLERDEVVFRPDDDPLPIIVARTIPA